MQKTLVIFIVSLFIIFLIVTAIALTSGKGVPAKNLRKTDPTPDKILTNSDTPTKIYTGLGTIRCSTADVPSIPMVIAPYFPYPADDSAFFEEISSKTRKLQQIIIQYIHNYTQDELIQKSEHTIKSEILTQFNSTLVMGQISNLYFDEYIFFE